MPLPDRIVLASTSPFRRAMLVAAGVEHEAVDPMVNERSISPSDPAERARQRALAKARAVVALRGGGNDAVIGADQVCHLDGEVFSKPIDDTDHLRQLRRLRGRTHTLSDGVAVLCGGTERSWVTEVRVTLRDDLGDEELAAYVAAGDAAGCAGGYRLEGLGAQLIARVEGDAFAVVGLPLLELVSELRALGWRPFHGRNKSPAPMQSPPA